MIKPHGSDELRPLYVEDVCKRRELLKKSQSIQQIIVSSATASNAVMLAGGYFTPLSGFMSKTDMLSVAEKMRTADGVFFPIPVANIVSSVGELTVGKEVALLDPNIEGHPVLAVQTVSAIQKLSESEIQSIAEKVYGTVDKAHPGVATFLNQGRYVISGSIEVLNFSYFETDFPNTFQTAKQIRAQIQALGWKKTIAFQTRNPMHLAHEELCKIAMREVEADGCIIHMLLGKVKSDDIPAEVRDQAINVMVEKYFDTNSVLVSGYGFDMLYAGPREAVLHALFRQNMGASHFIIGRDHAGVGSYYGDFDSQKIFEQQVPKNALDIAIFNADHTAYSKKLGKVVMMKDVENHQLDDFILLSGRKVREMLCNGELPPPEFSRPEVARVLMEYYQSL